MSWNNVLPFWILRVEKEEQSAKMLCSFQEEIDAGWLYSTPPRVSVPLREYTEEELAELVERNRKISEENSKKYEGEW